MNFETIRELLLGVSLPFEIRLAILFLLIATVAGANGFHWIIKRRSSWLGLTQKIQSLQESRLNLPNLRVLRWLDSAWRKFLLAEFMFLRHGNLAPYSILALTTFFLLLIATFATRPFIVRASPGTGAYLANAEQPITVEFNLPIDEKVVQLYISPEVMGRWEFEKTIFNLPLAWKVKFYPDESFFPGKKIVVYVTGLRARWGEENPHEQAIELFAPRIPQISSISPANGAENIPADAPIEIKYDAPLGKFVETYFELTPKKDFVVQEDTTKQLLTFKEPLEQGEQYTLLAYQALRSYRILDGEDIEKSNVTQIGQITFKTAEAPLVSSYTPKGSGTDPREPLKITFSQEMIRTTTEKLLHITPETEGKVTWEDNQNLIFTPKDGWQKGTRYEISLLPGITSKFGGITSEKVTLTFETAGNVKVNTFSPAAGTSGVDPTQTNVMVEFDQEIDHENAQQHFSISPNVSGNFSWDGRKMTYQTAGKLTYSTRYDVKVAAGVKTIYGLDSTENFQSYFVTASNTFTLNIPQYYQDPRYETFNCNLVAVQMVLAYKGISVTQTEVKSALGVGQDPNANFVEGYGTHTGPIAQYLASKGIKYAIKNGWNVAALAQEVKNGNPVILWWYNRYSTPKGAFALPGGYTGYKGMHSEVVRGFIGPSSNPTYLLTNDPWRGQLTYSQSLFLSTWSYLNYTAIVVY